MGTSRPSPGALRMSRFRDRRRRGLHCVTLQIWEREIEALVRRGLLAPGKQGDRLAIVEAMHRLLDVTLLR
jgi:hypothetical protein